MPEDTPYVVGPVHGNRQPYATFETKPSVPEFTGGGYEHWRSTETRPHTATQGAEDVYCSHHRLLAIVACYDAERPLPSVLDDLRGKDVHHRTGIPWDNRPSNLEVRSHGEHAEITNTKRRAWAENRKREVRAAESQPVGYQTDSCDNCGERVEAGKLAESDAWPGEERCIECAIETAPDGAEIRV